jgi:hypothetical protein
MQLPLAARRNLWIESFGEDLAATTVPVLGIPLPAASFAILHRKDKFPSALAKALEMVGFEFLKTLFVNAKKEH